MNASSVSSLGYRAVSDEPVSENVEAVEAVCMREEWRGDGCGAGGQTHGQGVDVDDHEVKGHGEGHGTHQPDVAPGGHAQQGLVLRQAGEGGRRRKVGSDGGGGGVR